MSAIFRLCLRAQQCPFARGERLALGTALYASLDLPALELAAHRLLRLRRKAMFGARRCRFAQGAFRVTRSDTGAGLFIEPHRSRHRLAE